MICHGDAHRIRAVNGPQFSKYLLGHAFHGIQTDFHTGADFFPRKTLAQILKQVDFPFAEAEILSQILLLVIASCKEGVTFGEGRCSCVYLFQPTGRNTRYSSFTGALQQRARAVAIFDKGHYNPISAGQFVGGL